eukprot:m.48272 g.48272  ORF g.48272 m.48272 type:complete len:141 (+) comp6411_c0_seq1:459-881(+)
MQSGPVSPPCFSLSCFFLFCDPSRVRTHTLLVLVSLLSAFLNAFFVFAFHFYPALAALAMCLVSLVPDSLFVVCVLLFCVLLSHFSLPLSLSLLSTSCSCWPAVPLKSFFLGSMARGVDPRVSSVSAVPRPPPPSVLCSC